MEELKLPHILTKFINEVLKWISLFYEEVPGDVKEGKVQWYHSREYHEMPLAIWNFIDHYRDHLQIVESMRKERFCSCIKQLFSTRHFSIDNDNKPLIYNSSTIRDWFMRWIYHCQSQFDIHVTNTIIPEKQWYLIETKTDAPYLSYFGIMNILKYIFGYFELGFVFLDKKDEIYRHEWHFTKKQYLRCLNIFPRWTIYVHKSWRKKIKKWLNLYLLQDVSTICLSYLRFSNNDCKSINYETIRKKAI